MLPPCLSVQKYCTKYTGVSRRFAESEGLFPGEVPDGFGTEQVFNKVIPAPLGKVKLVGSGVPVSLAGEDQHVEGFVGALQHLCKFECCGRIHILINASVRDEQFAFQVLGHGDGENVVFILEKRA